MGSAPRWTETESVRRPPHRRPSAVLPARARELLQLLAAPEAAPGLRVNELADLSGMPRSAVGTALSELEARGAVVHRGGLTRISTAGTSLLEGLERGPVPTPGWRPPRPPADEPDATALRDPRRLRAVRETAAPQCLDGVAELARRWLRTPIALVHLVGDGDAVLQGAAGLPEDAPRALPIEQTPCQEVLLRAGEVVVGDALADERTAAYPLVRGGLARAYLGMPLLAADGELLGVLCAMAGEPRSWTPREVAAARSLAGVAEARLRLRRVAA
jgi:hypothetical protein